MLTAINAAAILALKTRLEQDQKTPLLYALPALLLSETLSSFLTTRDVFSSLLSAILSLLLTPLTALVFVLLGAPATTLLAETLACSAIVTIITVQPMVARYGIEISFWRRAFALDLPLTEVYGGFLGGIVGAWLGAVPIALDWDRPWQQWPITVLFGASLGTAVGNLVGLLAGGGDDKYGIDAQHKADKAALKKLKARQEAQAKAKAQAQKPKQAVPATKKKAAK